jgi:hypothetical protein
MQSQRWNSVGNVETRQVLSKNVHSMWRVIAVLSFLGLLTLTALYLRAEKQRHCANNMRTALAAQLQHTRSNIMHVQSDLSEIRAKENISGQYISVDVENGHISSSSEKLTVFYEHDTVTVGVWQPYITSGSGTQAGESFVSTSSSGSVLGTYTVKLKFNFADANVSVEGSGRTFILHTESTSNDLTVPVKLMWPEMGGAITLFIGDAAPVAYVKDNLDY